jgi:hypothetical protein
MTRGFADARQKHLRGLKILRGQKFLASGVKNFFEGKNSLGSYKNFAKGLCLARWAERLGPGGGLKAVRGDNLWLRLKPERFAC